MTKETKEILQVLFYKYAHTSELNNLRYLTESDFLELANDESFPVEKPVGMPSETLSCELNAIKHGLDAIAGEAKRQRKLAETFSDNEESKKFHTQKAYYFEDVLRIIEKNKEFYIKNLASKH